MQAEQTVQAAPAAAEYPKRPSTCEIVDGPEGQPGTQVRCAHCGQPFKTTAWNWARRNFIARKCQDAIRALKAAAGHVVTRRSEPGAVKLGSAARAAAERVPTEDIPEGFVEPPPTDLVWASPLCGEQPPRYVFRTDMTETFPEQPAGVVYFDFADGAPAREGREIVTCPVCDKLAERGAQPWPDVTVYLHLSTEEPDTRRGAPRGARARKMLTWCVVRGDDSRASFVNGRQA